MSEKFQPYISKENKEIDFESKRLQFWLETVPPDVRRIEYDLWKRYRTLHHLNLHQFEHKEKKGRFTVTPQYSPGQEEIDWKEFSHTFLTGEDRQKRFRDIIKQTETDLPKIFETLGDDLQQNVLIVALTGSTAYGPRKLGSRFSDTDLRLLFDVADDSLNTEIMPNAALKELGTPYHIIGTGTTDTARGPHSDIHWLLYPHYPLQNHLSDTELKKIIANLVDETQAKSDTLKNRVTELEEIITEKRKGVIIG